jgi:hypothetical protein
MVFLQKGEGMKTGDKVRVISKEGQAGLFYRWEGKVAERFGLKIPSYMIPVKLEGVGIFFFAFGELARVPKRLGEN